MCCWYNFKDQYHHLRRINFAKLWTKRHMYGKLMNLDLAVEVAYVRSNYTKSYENNYLVFENVLYFLSFGLKFKHISG